MKDHEHECPRCCTGWWCEHPAICDGPWQVMCDDCLIKEQVEEMWDGGGEVH